MNISISVAQDKEFVCSFVTSGKILTGRLRNIGVFRPGRSLFSADPYFYIVFCSV